MDRKERLQNIWAVTDKQSIDIMTRKTRRLPPDLIHEDSSDGTSDSDSDSNRDFIALPEEFRPNLRVNKQSPQEQINVAKNSLNQNSKNPLIQSPTTSGKPTNNTLTNRSKNLDQTSSLQQNKEVSVKHNQSSVCKTGTNSKIHHQIVQKVACQNYDRCEEISANTSGVKRKIITEKNINPVRDNELLPKQSAVSISNECKNKKSLKYEFVQREKRQTIHLKFDALSIKGAGSVLNDGLKYETKIAHNAYLSPKNSTHAGNRIKKPNPRKKSNLMVGQFSASSQQSTVKWDNSLSLNYEQDSKIEWTLIREKTSMRVRGNITSQQWNNELVSGNYHTNRAVSKNYSRKYINPSHDGFNNNHYTKQKTDLQINSVHMKHSKCNCEKLALEKNSTSTDNFKYIVKSSDSVSDTEFLDSGESSCRLQQYTAGRQNVGNMARQSSSDEESHLQKVDDQSYHRKVQLSNGNKKPHDLSLPAGLSFTRKENLDAKLSEALKKKRESILRYGREISDLIIGSYIALDMLISFYREWTHARRVLIFHFEELGKHLKESSKKFSGWTDVLQFARSGAEMASVIPHPIASAAAKAVSLITGLLQTLLKTKQTEQANVDDSHQITRAMLKDTNTTSDLYIYSLQCSQQFEETTEIIKKFHSDADIQGYFDQENAEITTFIRGFLEFNPNHRVFYKKLRICFQELLQTSTDDFSRQFCEPFTLYSSPAIDVIEHLGWRFRNDDFDGSSVRYELEEINRLIQNNSSTGINDLQKRIQNCIGILKDELEFMESRIKEIKLFEVSSHNK